MTTKPNSQFAPDKEEAKSLFERMKDKIPQSKQLIVENIDASVVATMAGVGVQDVHTEDPFRVLIVLDSSASMSGFRLDAIEGFKTMKQMLQNQSKKLGVVILMGLMTFDDPTNIKKVLPFTPIDKIDDNAFNTYNPMGGSTALLDGTFQGLTGLAAYNFYLFENKIRGGRQFFVVISDSLNNNSRRIQSPSQIAALISDLRMGRNAAFSFLGLGPDSEFRPYALQMGFKDRNIRSFTSAEGGLASALDFVSKSVQYQSVALSQGKTTADDDDEPQIIDNDEEENFF